MLNSVYSRERTGQNKKKTTTASHRPLGEMLSPSDNDNGKGRFLQLKAGASQVQMLCNHCHKFRLPFIGFRNGDVEKINCKESQWLFHIDCSSEK